MTLKNSTKAAHSKLVRSNNVNTKYMVIPGNSPSVKAGIVALLLMFLSKNSNVNAPTKSTGNNSILHSTSEELRIEFLLNTIYDSVVNRNIRTIGTILNVMSRTAE